jgi:putative tryptophan/tyrosine transport system substrate-binding protein
MDTTGNNGGKKVAMHSLVVLFALILAFARLAEAQQPTKIPRIGFLTGSGDPLPYGGPLTKGFRQGLQDLGYVEGKTFTIEYRAAEGKIDRIPTLVDELVRLKVDVLVVTTAAVRAAKEATKTIPIVMVVNVDPVATGLIDSLARPGGNITGLTTLTYELSGKRLELLTELVPRLARVAVLWDADSRPAASAVKEYEVSGRALNLQVQSLEVRGPNPDIEGAFQSAAKGRANALIAVRSSLLLRNMKRIADLAIKHRLPSMYEEGRFVEAGGLVFYSSNDAENYRRIAYYVDKILKGSKPADLPVEQPTKFEFVINLKTAKQIGVTIPPDLLARATKIIK